MSIDTTNHQFCGPGEFYHPEASPDISRDVPYILTLQRDFNNVKHPPEGLDFLDEQQILPDLDDDEYRALRNDIANHGVQEPVIVDEDGIIIDGRHRVQACKELGYSPGEIPRKVRRGLDEREKRELAYRLNLQRRHLNSGQKRTIAERYLATEWDGEATEKEVADILGIGKTTVHRALESLRADGKLVQVDDFSIAEQQAQIRTYLDEHPAASNREIARNIQADITHPTVSKRRKEIETGESGVSAPGAVDAEQMEGAIGDAVQSPSSDSSSSRPLPTPTDEPHPESDERGTPQSFVQPIAAAVDGFDLDPAAGAEDVPLATETFTLAEDGLQQDWFGDVWLNPPYSNMPPWVDKIQTELAADRVDSIVLLCRGDSSTDWWQRSAVMATLIVAVDRRLSFGEKDSSSPFANHVMLFGIVTEDLIEALNQKGLLLTVIPGPREPAIIC